MKKEAQDTAAAAKTDVNDQAFNDGWDEFEEQDTAGKKPPTLKSDDPNNTDDGMLDGEDLDADDDGQAAATLKKPDSDAAGDDGEDDAEEETDFDAVKLNDEIAKLQQKIRSAEGRLAKQESDSLRSSVATMKEEIKKLQETQKLVAPSDDGAKGKKAADKTAADDEIVPDGFTKEEWAAYQNDFPEIARGLLTQEKARRRDVDDAKQRIAKIEQASKEKQDEELRKAFDAEILKVHPDYKQIETQEADKVIAFIKAQEDPIEQRVLFEIVESGSQKEIIGLMNRYKVWRDGQKPSQKQPLTNGTTSKRIAGATAVPGRGGSRPDVSKSGAPDKDDFDGAWDEFEKTDRKK